jgi:hypothetical protein
MFNKFARFIFMLIFAVKNKRSITNGTDYIKETGKLQYD